MTDTKVRRTDSIRVRLAPEMLDRLDAVARGLGMPPATVGAFAVAKLVQEEEAKQSVMERSRRDLVEHAAQNMDEQTNAIAAQIFGDPEMVALLRAQAMRAAGGVQGGLPLDDGANPKGSA